MAIEIVDFPMKNGGSFHCYGTVHQRVSSRNGHTRGGNHDDVPLVHWGAMVKLHPSCWFLVIAAWVYEKSLSMHS